jgi:hypothetical protein
MHCRYNQGSGHICFNEVNCSALWKFLSSSRVAAVRYVTTERVKCIGVINLPDWHNKTAYLNRHRDPVYSEREVDSVASFNFQIYDAFVVTPVNRNLFLIADKYDQKIYVPDCQVHVDGKRVLYSTIEKQQLIDPYSKPLESHSSFIIQWRCSCVTDWLRGKGYFVQSTILSLVNVKVEGVRQLEARTLITQLSKQFLNKCFHYFLHFSRSAMNAVNTKSST